VFKEITRTYIDELDATICLLSAAIHDIDHPEKSRLKYLQKLYLGLEIITIDANHCFEFQCIFM